MKEYKYFRWFSDDQQDNTEELNTLLIQGWIPERETAPSNPACAAGGETGHKFWYESRYLLILLSRAKNG